MSGRDINQQIAKLGQDFDKLTSLSEKDRLYKELLAKYDIAQKRINELESELKANKLPTKDEVDAMSSMLDLVTKLDEATIEKLNKFGKSQQ